MIQLDNATNATAVSAITLPFWLPSLHSISATCAEWAPAFGIGWIVIQVGFKLWDRWRGTGE